MQKHSSILMRIRDIIVIIISKDYDDVIILHNCVRSYSISNYSTAYIAGWSSSTSLINSRVAKEVSDIILSVSQ